MRYVHQPAFQPHAVTTANQFEQQTMTAVRRGRLCVPSDVDGVPAAHAIDHFKCYALRSKPLATAVPVTLVDPLFGPATATATRAIEWCQAVSKNGEPVPVPGAHLTCYKLTDLAPHFSPMGAFLDNQFGMGQAVRARSVAELCVPDGTAVTTTTTTSTTTTTFSFACCSNGFGVCDYALTPELCGPISAGAPGSLCDAVTGTCIATASPGDCCNDLTLTLQGSQCFAGANANFQGQCGDFHPNSLCPTNGGPCSP